MWDHPIRTFSFIYSLTKLKRGTKKRWVWVLCKYANLSLLVCERMVFYTWTFFSQWPASISLILKKNVESRLMLFWLLSLSISLRRLVPRWETWHFILWKSWLINWDCSDLERIVVLLPLFSLLLFATDEVAQV